MTNITISIPENLKDEMEKFPEINWSQVARSAITQKLADLKFLRAFTEQSEITLEEAETLGRELSKTLAKRFFGD